MMTTLRPLTGYNGLMFSFLGLVACSEPQDITLSGFVFQSHDILSPVLPHAELAFESFEGVDLGSTTADDNGRFSIVVPGGYPLAIYVSADGYATSAFPGTVGISDQVVEDHSLYGVPTAELDALRAQLAGCPGLDDGAIVFGEVRIFGLSDPYSDESPTTSTAQVTVSSPETTWDGCYLDDKGLAYDPDAFFTGGTGRFAVPGVQPGLYDLVVETLVGPDTFTQNIYPVQVPPGSDVVSPWWPLWASFPL